MKFTIDINPKNVELANNLETYERTNVISFEADFEVNTAFEDDRIYTAIFIRKYHLIVDAFKNNDQILDAKEFRYVGCKHVPSDDFSRIYDLNDKTFIVNVEKQEIEIR